MYFKDSFYTPIPLKEKITHECVWGFWSLPSFGSIEEEDTLVELFAQEQEIPDVYNGEKVNVKIYLGDFSWDRQDCVEPAIQMIKNYVKNVGGEIKNIETKKFREGVCKTAKITVPKDAPYCDDLEKTFYDFLSEYRRVIARYELRHKEHKQLPDYRKETKYIEGYTDNLYSENFASVVIMIAVMLIAVILL